MNRFITRNCFVNSNQADDFTRQTVQDVRQAVLSSASLRPRIQEALERINFRFHRTCSFSNIIRDCYVNEAETLLMYRGCDESESRATMSVTASTCSSTQQVPAHQRDRELRSSSQQTDISCRIISGIASPVNEVEEQRLLRARIADSLTVSSPASSLVHPAGRSISLIGSVCALLLNKQGTVTPKDVPSFTGSLRSDICRICFGGESAERLVRPCGCRGTIAAVHRTCLERWLLQAATSYCELCRHHYIVTRSHKWSWIRSMAEWAVSGQGRALAADAWRGLVLGAASVLGTARALHACDAVLQAGATRGGGAALAANLFSSILIGVIGALNGLLTTWMLLKIQEHQSSWRAWRDSTLHVHVTLSPHRSPRASPHLTPQASDQTVVAVDSSTRDRSTNVADPFMVAVPYTLPDS
ncbi:uncharacterized protein LOC101741100 [Bombyx mori]|uniref:Uncharacterized protein n=1 Tax=Bombyx mori TaxID=7091 RepID=A0A8R2GDL7_BOMMO|nr:uncharacterized protein LOC101741100 [Bombyx mori]XP_021201977.1 uncharacterized protein LOC101741100 [Bombyx mori]XP_021201978.1 uncharacterized protein LOC101741100 [Bombyx mori]